ncbi:MAG: succinate dehydrogenase cytochrome b558 subunit [Myxococcales bacterium]|nr:succinate dehydrogenase cytochrome b558 subunit [Myxococcales bacterium]
MSRALELSASASDRDAPAKPSRRAFYLRRAHSLSGVVPLGGFLVLHLWTNASALGGQERFDDAVADIQRIPALGLLEVFGIFLPLTFHAVYGVVLARASRPNAGAYPFARNWLYVLQRVTGIIAFVFVMGHLWELRVQKLLFGMSARSFYPTLAAHMSGEWGGVAWIAVAYLVGVLACVFHFANGLFTASIAWGLTVTRAAQTRLGVACGVLGGALALLGTATVLAFATGMTFIPGRDRVEPKPCGKTETTAASSATVDAGASATTPPFPPGQSRPNQTPED